MIKNQEHELISRLELILDKTLIQKLKGQPEKCKNGYPLVQQEYATLFADFGGSTQLIDNYDTNFSTWLLKSYLSCVSSLIKHYGGVITAFEGDGLMGIFSGKHKECNAVKCAFAINWTLNNIIQPKIDELYSSYNYKIHQVVGIDTSVLTPIKTEIWEGYDIFWLGRSANYSANLTRINNPEYSTYVTQDVYDNLSKNLQGNEEDCIWCKMTEPFFNGTDVLRSNKALIQKLKF